MRAKVWKENGRWLWEIRQGGFCLAGDHHSWWPAYTTALRELGNLTVRV
jgi:hypothetical protein